MYHDVTSGGDADAVGFPGAVAARYKVDAAELGRQLDVIRSRSLAVGLVAPGAVLPAVALTFDDGGASALRAADALEARGWRGHFFVTTGKIDAAGFLTATEVAELAERGHVVGSHSHTHPTYMGRLSRGELEREWLESRERLGAVLGRPPEHASVPGGFLSPEVVETAAAAGFGVLMTSEPTLRPRRHDGLLVLGRYTIWAATPTERAADYAQGRLGPRARLWLAWKAKTLSKRVSPAAYERLRRLRAGG